VNLKRNFLVLKDFWVIRRELSGFKFTGRVRSRFPQMSLSGDPLSVVFISFPERTIPRRGLVPYIQVREDLFWGYGNTHRPKNNKILKKAISIGG